MVCVPPISYRVQSSTAAEQMTRQLINIYYIIKTQVEVPRGGATFLLSRDKKSHINQRKSKKKRKI
jgi:hypothetical protein